MRVLLILRRIFIYALLIGMAGATGYIVFLNISKIPEIRQVVLHEQLEKSVVYLYFADRESAFLKAEERKIVHPEDAIGFAKYIISALIKGPETDLERTIPVGTVLNAVYIAADGTAYVDMTKEIRENHPGGTMLELITIYSIVNSLVLNIPQIKTVKILIGKEEAQTLAGHVDLCAPFKANMLIIR